MFVHIIQGDARTQYFFVSTHTSSLLRHDLLTLAAFTATYDITIGIELIGPLEVTQGTAGIEPGQTVRLTRIVPQRIKRGLQFSGL